MNCSGFEHNLDDFIDDALDAGTRADAEAHASRCDLCAARLDAARALKERLGTRTDIAMPSSAFFAAAVARAAEEGARRRRRHHWLRGFGTALAASAVLFVLTFAVIDRNDGADAPNIPTVTMAVETPRTVNLVFASAESLRDARLTVSLPAGMSIPGFEGQRAVSWVTSLDAGRNVLPLPLVATAPGSGQLVATLAHGGEERSFRIHIRAS